MNSRDAPEEALRAAAPARPARSGQDAGADEPGDVVAVGDRRRGRADPRRGARQDRGPLRQGQGHVGADRDVGREPDAGSRASRPQQPGQGPSRRDPGPARLPDTDRGRDPGHRVVVSPAARPAPATPRRAPPPADRSSGRTTRSSRWTTSCGVPSRLRRAAAGDGREGGRAEAGQALAEDGAIGAGHVDGVAGLEGPVDTDHAGGQQRHPRSVNAQHRRRPGRRPRPARRSRSTACEQPAASPRHHHGADAGVPATASASTRAASRARSRRGRRTRPPSWRPRPSRPCPRSPTPCRSPASASMAWSTSTISSIGDADRSSCGSAVSSPAVSVRSTKRSALRRWATRAAMRSLSPKRISSSAMASFSLITGTTPSSSRRCEVPGVQVQLRHAEVERGEQHLAGHQRVRREGPVVHRHPAGPGRPPTPPGACGRRAAAGCRPARGPAGPPPAPEVTATTLVAVGPGRRAPRRTPRWRPRRSIPRGR